MRRSKAKGEMNGKKNAASGDDDDDDDAAEEDADGDDAMEEEGDDGDDSASSDDDDDDDDDTAEAPLSAAEKALREKLKVCCRVWPGDVALSGATFASRLHLTAVLLRLERSSSGRE